MLNGRIFFRFSSRNIRSTGSNFGALPAIFFFKRCTFFCTFFQFCRSIHGSILKCWRAGQNKQIIQVSKLYNWLDIKRIRKQTGTVYKFNAYPRTSTSIFTSFDYWDFFIFPSTLQPRGRLPRGHSGLYRAAAVIAGGAEKTPKKSQNSNEVKNGCTNSRVRIV